MPENPISNPGVTPSSPTPDYGRDKPRLGEGEETQEPKPFSLSPEGGKTGATEAQNADKPSPMDLAKEQGENASDPMTPEQLSEQLNHLKQQLNTTQNQLKDPNITNKFSQDHIEALGKVAEKITPDMKGIASSTETEFNVPKVPDESALNYVTKWLNGSQETLSSAMKFVGNQKNPNPAAFLKLQYSVQRAVQRGELFASVVGASVSGIKTIMSTQLG